jgi:phytoene dehydrogenase-like protein
MTTAGLGGRRYDVVVIGSGIGGLTAALTATRRGRSVLVLEAGKQYGGFTNPFKRGHYGFDPGLHYLGECGPGQSFRRLLDGLGLDGVAFRELAPDGFDRLVFPGYEVSTCKGADRYEARLAADFPRERDGLARFFDLVRGFRALSAGLTGKGLRARLEAALALPRFVRYARATYGELLDGLIADPLLKAVLAAQGGDYGLPPGRASALIGLAVLDHYLGGAWFPVGGSRALRDAFVHAIEAAGGVMLRNHAVSRVLLSGGRATGVLCANGEEARAGAVVSNADAALTFRDLVGTPNLPARLRRKVARTRLSVGSVCLFVGTDLDLGATSLTDANVWHFSGRDLDAAYEPLARGVLPGSDFFFLSSPTLKDPGSSDKAPPGHHTLELVALAPFEPFERWAGMKTLRRGADYERLKAELGDRFLGCIERYVPGIRDHVKVLEVATPATNVTYAAAPHGAIYGPEHTPDQMGPFRFSPKTPIDGLYLCGSSVLGAGIVPSAVSGRMAGKLATAS